MHTPLTNSQRFDISYRGKDHRPSGDYVDASFALQLELDLRTVIEVARRNLPRKHGTIERIAARLEVKPDWLDQP
jgi:hypothetical protein